jgi:hypothetical protein
MIVINNIFIGIELLTYSGNKQEKIIGISKLIDDLFSLYSLV